MNGRIWVYNAQRAVQTAEMEVLAPEMMNFIQNWKAHGKDLEASFEWLHQQILILKVNEDTQLATGCSIDSWMAFLQQIDVAYKFDFFKRDRIAIEQEGKLTMYAMNEIPAAWESGEISENALLLDHTISKLSDFDFYKKPILDSWIGRRLKPLVVR
jgi:hypothetical protein